MRRVGDDGAPLRPVHERRVVDWDQLESVYAHIFYRQLGWIEGDEGAALVTEPILTSRADRDRLTQMMFESFNVAGLYIVDQPVAALYGVGKTSGVSVDVGYAVTDVAPVVDGAVVTPGQRRRVGSSDVSAAPRAGRRRRRDTLRRRRRRRARRGARRRPRETAPGTARSRHPPTPHSHFRTVTSFGCPARRRVRHAALDPRAALRRARRGGGGVHAGPATGVSGRRARERVVGGGRGATRGVETRAMRNLEDALPPSQKPIAGMPEHAGGRGDVPGVVRGGSRQGGVRAAAACRRWSIRRTGRRLTTRGR